jgi:hypothetical protein
MNLRATIVLALVILMVGSTAGFLQYRRSHQKLGKPGIKLIATPVYDSTGNLLSTNSIYLPDAVPNFTSETQPVETAVLAWLPKDTTYGQRLYTTAEGLRIQVGVVMMGADRTSIHKPQYCLPAQGWTIQSTEADSIAISRPHPYSLPVVKIVARQEITTPDGQKIVRSGVNVFWFVSENKITASHNEWMAHLMKHLVLTGELERWSYVTCFTACEPGQEQAAYEKIKELVIAAVPEFQLVAGPPQKLAYQRTP